MDLHIYYLSLIIALVALSFFFSGAEIAFVTANRLKIEIKLRQNKSGATLASRFVNKPEEFLTTTLVGNNLTHVLYSTVMTFYLVEAFGIQNIFIKSFISSIVILVFGEIIPKHFFKDFADHIIYFISYPLRFFYFLLYPFVYITSIAATVALKVFGVHSANVKTFFHRHDVQLLLKEGEDTGNLAPEESEIIENVFEMKDLKVRECMIPRTDIVSIDVQSNIQECMEQFVESGYSKMPVYEESNDNVVGIVYAHDLFKLPTVISEIMRPVMFVPESKKASELMKEFRSSKSSVAIVVDEFGGTSGLVTLEDLIEELIGDIQDEFDTDEYISRQLDEKTFLLAGRTLVEDLNENYHLGIEEGDFETIGGFIIDRTGRIPDSGEIIEIDSFTITVIKATKNKIDLVKLQLKPMSDF